MKLPIACDAEYFEDFVSKEESAALLEWVCSNYDVQTLEEIRMADGSVHLMRPWKLMFVDQELTDFALFPEVHGRRIAWPPLVEAIRDRVEQFTGLEFSVCVCLYYHDGEDGIGFHYDPPAFGPIPLLPSVSLGEPREFWFRRREDHSDQYGLELDDGSLLIMGDGCQEEYEHSLPINHKYRNPRINLTFRQFRWPSGVERASRVV